MLKACHRKYCREQIKRGKKWVKTRKATNRQLMNSLKNILIEYSTILIIKLTLSTLLNIKKYSNEWPEKKRDSIGPRFISGNQLSGIKSVNIFLNFAHASQICGMHSIWSIYCCFDYVVENHINLIFWSNFLMCIACRDSNSDMIFSSSQRTVRKVEL